MEQINNLPTVTVVIPCHNHAQWVGDAINSVAAQSYQNKQIVVVDDGSTDGSADVIKGFFTDIAPLPANFGKCCQLGILSNGIKLLLARNEVARGPSKARNIGMTLSWDFTDIYGFLDSDDMYCQGKIQKSVDVLLNYYPFVSAVYSDYVTFNENKLNLYNCKEPFNRNRLVEECIINMDSLVLKEAIDKVGMQDEELRVCEDYDWWLRLTENYAAYHIAEPLVKIRVGKHSATANVPNQKWQEDYGRVKQKLMRRCGVSS